MIYPRWWANQRFAKYNESLSILDLVNKGTIDCKLAAMLWLLVEHRASILVAAGPSFAGKTTLLHALLDFLPPDVKQIRLRGYYEDFSFLEHSQPDNSYLVTEEISNHMDEYLWGSKAIRAFKLLSQGYSMGGTIHARSAEEVVYILHNALGLSLSLLTQIGIIVTLRVSAGRDYEDEPLRRISSVSLVLPDKEGLAIQVIAAQQYTERGFEYAAEKTLQSALAGKHISGKCLINAEIEARERYLKHLREKGCSSRKEVRKSVLDFYRSNMH